MTEAVEVSIEIQLSNAISNALKSLGKGDDNTGIIEMRRASQIIILIKEIEGVMSSRDYDRAMQMLQKNKGNPAIYRFWLNVVERLAPKKAEEEVKYHSLFGCYTIRQRIESAPTDNIRQIWVDCLEKIRRKQKRGKIFTLTFFVILFVIGMYSIYISLP